jgi:hypothetical protein
LPGIEGGEIMKVIYFSFIVACIASVALSQSADTTKSKTPILVELFTSEGCSSCPPADVWLQKVDASQPIPGAQMIVLSEHVDYWDHDGWKDPYSLALFTDRQSGYVRAMELSTAYTPQAIVNGKSELRLSEPQQISQVLVKAASTPQVPVGISSLSVEGSVPPVLRAHVLVEGGLERRNADIFAAVALDHAESQVAHGENGGKLLTHVAVVQEFVKIGKLEKEKVFNEDVQVKLRPNTDSRNLRLIVFVQEPELGRVLGTALQKSGLAGKLGPVCWRSIRLEATHLHSKSGRSTPFLGSPRQRARILRTVSGCLLLGMFLVGL